MSYTLEPMVKKLRGVLTKNLGMALAVHGGAGVGKTYTVQHLLAAVPCLKQSLHATTPLVNILRQMPCPPNLPVWAVHVVEQSERGEPIDTQTGWQALVLMLSKQAPIVLHLEDIHEARPEQLEGICALARAVKQTKGVALLVTTRSAPPQEFEAHQLEPLTLEKTQQILEEKLQASLPSDAIAWIFEKAAGNPLFSLEFMRHLARQGFLWNDGRRWNWRRPNSNTMPVTVEALLETSLKTVLNAAPELRPCLEARSLLGLEVAPDVWVATLAPDVWAATAGLTPEALELARLHLEQVGLLRGQFFAHPLFAEVIQAQLSSSSKEMYAKRAIAQLQTQHPMAASAFLPLANLENTAAKRLLYAAAQEAAQRGQPTQQLRLLSKAVAYLSGIEHDQQALDVAYKLRHIDVLEALTLVESIAQTSPVYPQAMLLIAELQATQGQAVRAEATVRQFYRTESPKKYMHLIWIRALGNNDLGALELLQAHPEALDHANAEILYRAARVLAQHGQLEPAKSILTSQIGFDEESTIWLLKGKSYIAYLEADYAQMEAVEAEIYNLSSRLGNLRWMDAAVFNRAMALDVLGRQQERVQCLEIALRLCLEMNDLMSYMIAQTMYAESLQRTGEFERAETLLLDAIAYLEGLDISVYLMDAELNLVWLYFDWQPPQAKLLAHNYAKKAFEHAKILGSDRYHAQALSALATVLAWIEQPHNALPVAQEALLRAGSSMPVHQAEAWHALGYVRWKLGQDSDALHALQEAQKTALGFRHQALYQRIGVLLDVIEQKPERVTARLEWFSSQGLENEIVSAKRYFSDLEPVLPVQSKRKYRLLVLGTLRLEVDGAAQTIRGKKRQALLVLLLEAKLQHQSSLSRLELVDKLYPQDDEFRATSNLKKLVHSTRTELGHELIQTTPHGYALGDVDADVIAFLENPEPQLWRGTYLQDVPIVATESVHESLLGVLHMLTSSLLETDHSQAIRLAKILLEMNPYDLENLRLLLRALKTSQNHKTLGRVYNAARERMQEVQENLPGRWQDFLTA